MSFTEKMVVAKISAKAMHSIKVMQVIQQMKSSVVALFSVNPMYSVNLMSVKVMLHCIQELTKNTEFDTFQLAEVFARTKDLKPTLAMSYETSCHCASSNVGFDVACGFIQLLCCQRIEPFCGRFEYFLHVTKMFVNSVLFHIL